VSSQFKTGWPDGSTGTSSQLTLFICQAMPRIAQDCHVLMLDLPKLSYPESDQPFLQRPDGLDPWAAMCAKMVGNHTVTSGEVSFQCPGTHTVDWTCRKPNNPHPGCRHPTTAGKAGTGHLGTSVPDKGSARLANCMQPGD
jgi:hypothetical protein